MHKRPVSHHVLPDFRLRWVGCRRRVQQVIKVSITAEGQHRTLYNVCPNSHLTTCAQHLESHVLSAPVNRSTKINIVSSIQVYLHDILLSGVRNDISHVFYFSDQFNAIYSIAINVSYSSNYHR